MARFAAPVVIIAGAVASVWLSSSSLPTGDAAFDRLDRIVPLAFTAAAIGLWWARSPAALALTAASVVWTGPGLFGGSIEWHAWGALGGPLIVPLVAGAVIATIASRTRITVVVAVGLASIAVAVIGIWRALIYDPFLDVDCARRCVHNPLLLTADVHLASRLTLVGLILTAFVWTALAAMTVVAHLGQPSRSRPFEVALGALALLALAAAAIVDAAIDPVIAPHSDAAIVTALRSVAAVVLAAAMLTWAIDRIRRTRSVVAAAALIEPTSRPGELERRLREALSDPCLKVSYVGDAEVRDEGKEIARRPTEAGRLRTELVSRGRILAVVDHSAQTVPVKVLRQELGLGFQIALQNERLQRLLEIHIDDLRMSRQRIVETGDAIRRRLEADLHDGAQQRIFALLFELRRGQRLTTDPRCRSVLDESVFVAERLLEELRLLAHGIFPAILEQGGLEAALRYHADVTRHWVSLVIEDEPQASPELVMTLYATITELLDAAREDNSDTGKEAQPVTVQVQRTADRVRVYIDRSVDVTEHIHDRIGAASGSIRGDQLGIEISVPCG